MDNRPNRLNNVPCDPAYDALKPMISGMLNIKHVRANWDEILQLATSING